jgi:hypothetical protein
MGIKNTHFGICFNEVLSAERTAAGMGAGLQDMMA